MDNFIDKIPTKILWTIFVVILLHDIPSVIDSFNKSDYVGLITKSISTILVGMIFAATTYKRIKND